MFGLSLPKLLFTVVIIAAVWYAFRWFQNREAGLDDARRGQKPVGGGAAGAKDAKSAGGAEDMVECPTCGTYVVASGATSCGKKDCPYRG